MKSKTENAVELFRSGMNCAQSVVMTFSDKLDFDREIAARISCGFGGGMGRLQETCGAVTGSFMVLGTNSCRNHSDNSDRKEAAYSDIQKFSEKFISIYGTMNCKELLNANLRTAEGQQQVKENNLQEVVCEKCIADAIKITSELMK
jgi:C_GCAxxG_C_C family probable redox protein